MHSFFNNNKFKPSWNLIFWTTHFITLTGLILPLFLMTPMIEGFTFGVFHNTVSILEFGIVFFILGIFRTLLNRYIDWKNINFIVVIKVIFFTIIGGGILQLIVHYSLQATTASFFSYKKIPDMYFGGEELRFADTILKIFSWVFGFFTIKMAINYNAFKLEGIALIDKVKQEEINNISGQIDADFMEYSIELIKKLVLVDVHKARDTLTQLSNILRYSLTQENFKYVTINEELVVIQDYLNLISGQCESELLNKVSISKEFQNVLIEPMKFMSVIKKIVNCNTTLISITMRAMDDIYMVVMKTNSFEELKDIGLKNKDLFANKNILFSKYDNFELTVVNNEFDVSFEISKTAKH